MSKGAFLVFTDTWNDYGSFWPLDVGCDDLILTYARSAGS